MYRLKKVEQETIVNFNEQESRADVYTYNPAWIRKLRQLSAQFPKDVKIERPEKHGGYTYSVPKSWIKLHAPRVYSEEQKKAMRERLHANMTQKSPITVGNIDTQTETQA